MRILLFFLFTPLFAYSQTVERGGFSPVSTGSASTINYSSIEGIQGHKYLFDSWSEGTLIINDTIRSFQPKLQFDLVSGDIILGSEKLGNKGFIILDNSVTGFILRNKNDKFHYIRKEKNEFLNLTIDRKYFVRPLQAKNDYLLINYTKTLTEPSSSKSTYTSTDNDKKYKKKTFYYLMGKDKKYVKISSLKKKQVLNLLSDKKEELKNYIAQNKLDLRDENEVAKLLTYYHSLQSSIQLSK